METSQNAAIENQTISKRLRALSTLALVTSLVVIVFMLIGFGGLFAVKDHQRRAEDILLYLEKAAGNMNQVNSTMESYLLSPDQSGIWDDREDYENSALSFINLALQESRDQEITAALQDITNTIQTDLSSMEDDFAKKISTPDKAKDFYQNKYLPEMQAFQGKINVARSHAQEMSDKYNREINETMYMIAGLVFLLMVANGAIIIRKSRRIATDATQLLEEVCIGLVQNAKTVQNASHQVESSSATLAEAAGEQASSHQETASSIEEILRILTRNSQHAAANLEICQKGQQETTQGKKVVDSLRGAMEEFQNLNDRLENLIKIIGDIDAKTNIINDIAFQTRILSFNASVEAARSGEHGKGFAVVAEEVGKLSALSKDAAEEIKSLIATSGEAVTEAVRMTQEKISNTREISMRATEIFDSFHRVMGQIMAATEQMMTAAMEQQTGMEQIRSTMVEVSNATEITSENSEKLLSYARNLGVESEGMRKMVNQLSALIVEKTAEFGDLIHFQSQDQTAPAEAKSAN